MPDEFCVKWDITPQGEQLQSYLFMSWCRCPQLDLCFEEEVEFNDPWKSLSNWTVLWLLLIVANSMQTVPLSGIGENLFSCLKVSSVLHLVAQSCSWGPDLPYRHLGSKAGLCSLKEQSGTFISALLYCFCDPSSLWKQDGLNLSVILLTCL